MTIGAFFKAVESDIEAVFRAIAGSPAVAQVELVAVRAVSGELKLVVEKFLGVGTPLDAAAEAGIDQLAKYIVSKIPQPQQAK